MSTKKPFSSSSTMRVKRYAVTASPGGVTLYNVLLDQYGRVMRQGKKGLEPTGQVATATH